jgi:hydroxyacylglutathione hydrolase
VWEVPGHTLGHIAYIFRSAGIAFVGDTLFAMGCGRLFEGTPDQMFASLTRLAALPGETLAYCAHEYTLANARFAAHAEPDNEATADRLAEVERLRGSGQMTVPTTIALERATNPFIRAASVADFADRRAAKDSFR